MDIPDPYAKKVEIPLLEHIKTEIVNPLITLLAVSAFAVFLFGLLMFIINSGDAEAREKGKRVMLWGVVGLLIIFGAWAIVNLIAATLGIDSGKLENVR